MLSASIEAFLFRSESVVISSEAVVFEADAAFHSEVEVRSVFRSSQLLHKRLNVLKRIPGKKAARTGLQTRFLAGPQVVG